MIAVEWGARDVPLVPEAVAATGASAEALVRRLLARDDLGALSGVATAEAVVVLGAAESLPWADGVVYLGRDPRAPALLVPTPREPTVPIALLEAALVRRFGPGPLAVIPTLRIAIPTASARPLTREALTRWLAGPIGSGA